MNDKDLVEALSRFRRLLKSDQQATAYRVSKRKGMLLLLIATQEDCPAGQRSRDC